MHEVDRTWKVGELARETGLTIRALHHYDEIGLLVPGRTQSGHRVYSSADVERLYRVLALRGVGMALDEIAAVLDDDGASLIDTVRRHVAAVERDIEQRRRLLDRLREMLDALERSSVPSVDQLIGAVEAMTVVQATIEDVVTREPWEAAWELTAPCVVLLRETAGERMLPIWIGEPEAAALVVQRQGATLPRPMTPDLTVTLLDAIGARIERVVIERLRDHTFFATVTVTFGGDLEEVDARPSDALNLAVRAGAPIHVASELIETAGLRGWPDAAWPEAAMTAIASDDPPPWTPLTMPRSSSRTPIYAVGEQSPAMLRRAAAAARELGHGAVASVHLPLGILSDEDDPAARLLHRHRIELPAAREAVATLLPPAQNVPPPGQKTFLERRATLAMHRASTEALRRRSADIAPMHVLLALVDSPDAKDILVFLGADLAALRTDVLAELGA